MGKANTRICLLLLPSVVLLCLYLCREKGSAVPPFLSLAHFFFDGVEFCILCNHECEKTPTGIQNHDLAGAPKIYPKVRTGSRIDRMVTRTIST